MDDPDKTVLGVVETIKQDPKQLAFLSSLTVAPQDLSSDNLLASTPRAMIANLNVPSIGGIPLFARLGRGGMGAVYYGVHPRLKKEVAVKIMTLNATESPAAVERFFREAQIAAGLASPNLIGVLDVNQEHGLCFIVMEYVYGISAGALVKQVVLQGKPGLDELTALDICIAAAEGLSAAHNIGIIHRDIKPDNIIVPYDKHGYPVPAKSKLADLGLARSMENAGQSLTGDGVLGTLGYMAPEQTRSARLVTKSSDVFSLGATLYALLTGKTPFTGSSPVEIILATVQNFPTLMTKYRDDLTGTTLALIDRCLSKNPDDRPADAHELLVALRECRDGAAEPSRPSAKIDPVQFAPHIKPAPADSNEELKTIKYAQPEPEKAIARPAERALATVGATAIAKAQKSVSVARPLAKRKEKSSRIGMISAFALVSAVLAAGAYFIWGGEKKEAKALPQSGGLAASAAIAANSEPAKAAVHNTADELAKEMTLDLPGGAKMELVLIPAGTFQMGSPEGQTWHMQNEKQHTVTISKPFYMAKYSVTQEQYEAVMNANPSYFTSENGGGPTNPVEHVSWNDATEFCDKLDSLVKARIPRGMKLQLPTEAQWEYACRAGTTTRFYMGNDDADLAGAGWSASNSGLKTHPVGQKTPNAFGLFDMLGNVDQWCQDWHMDDYEKLPAKDPCNNAQTGSRVIRGGSWYRWPSNASKRGSGNSDLRSDEFGFRVAASLPPEQKPKPSPTSISPGAVLGKDAPKELSLECGGGVKLDMLLIPPGKFMMGAPTKEDDPEKNAAQHEVAISKPFYMGKYPVTQEQYEAVTGLDASHFKNPKNPVHGIHWYAAYRFCAILNHQLEEKLPPGMVIELPTEAQWEYACRAGTTTRYYSGNDERDLGEIAYYKGNSDERIHPVGQKKPNAFGLYDMLGNVNQYCSDAYIQNYESLPPIDPFSYKQDADANSKLPGSIVVRGLAFDDQGTGRASWRRGPEGKISEHIGAGFRVVLAAPPLVDLASARTPVNFDIATFRESIELLPPAFRLKAVIAKMKELNPGYDGEYNEADGDPLVLSIRSSTPLESIGPLAALRNLRKLDISGRTENTSRNKIKDLSPLKSSTSLVELTFDRCSISDLSPLRGLNLKYLWCGDNFITTLQPLAEMKLEGISAGNNPIRELSPLAKMPLSYVNVDQTGIRDLSALINSPLEKLNCSGTRVDDLGPLKGKKIETLNIEHCDRITDYSTLTTLTQLKDLRVDVNAHSLPVLKSLNPAIKINDGKSSKDF